MGLAAAPPLTPDLPYSCRSLTLHEVIFAYERTMGRFGPAFLDQDDHGRGAQDDLFPRVSPKMIMVGVVGVRENASWPRIFLGPAQDDHGPSRSARGRRCTALS